MGNFPNSRFIEDFSIGDEFFTGSFTLDEDSLLSFSKEYDPQPLHTDPNYARLGPFGGLIASGIQTIAISIKLFVEMGFFHGTCLAGPAIDEIRFTQPVRVGDTIRCKVTILEARPSKKSPSRGVLRTYYEVFNQSDLEVLSHKTTTIIQSRHHKGDDASHIIKKIK